MAQETLVLKLGSAERSLLEERLSSGTFEHRSVPHALFSVRGEGVVATLYHSGKLVVQGADPRAFALRYLDEVPAAAPSPGKGGGDWPTDRPLVGGDEAGKGDFLGPLVVVALRLEPDRREDLVRAGVADSKTLDDERMRRLAPALASSFEHAVEVLAPPDYNREYARVKNLNQLLAELHARAIRRVAHEGDAVLVDRFGPERLVGERVKDLPIDLFQFPRAEREAAVAAASVIARVTYVEAMHELSEEWAVELRKGAGAPTDRSAREFLALHGVEKLPLVAKMHFKNARKLGIAP